MGTTGKIGFRGFETWYRIEGDLHTGPTPLVVLHGGPGLPRNYLEPLAELSAGGRAVVFYDQLGCGNSDQPDDDSLWTMATFEDELAVLDGLGIGGFHLRAFVGWLAGNAVGPRSSAREAGQCGARLDPLEYPRVRRRHPRPEPAAAG